MASTWTLYKNGINKAGEDVTAQVGVGSTVNERQDYALDEGTLVLSPLSNSEPLDPRETLLSYQDIDGETEWYRLVSDAVTVVQRGASLAYRHELQYASLSRDLAFHLIRGCDFSQPKNRGKVVGGANSTGIIQTDGSIVENFQRVLPATTNEKAVIKSGYLKLETWYATSTTDPSSTGVYALAKGGTTAVIQAGSVVSCLSDGTSQTTLFAFSLITEGEVALTSAQIALINNAMAQGLYIAVTPLTPTAFLVGTKTTAVVMHASVVLETYYYTYLDVINGLLKAAHRPSTSSFTELEPFVVYPTSGAFYAFLSTTIAPDFQFAQGMTLWDALSEVFRAFDAQPVLSPSSTGSAGVCQIGAKYFNERTGALSGIGSVADASTTVSDEGRSPALVCKYQNGYPRNVEAYPGRGGFGYAYSKALGVPSSDDLWFSPRSKAIDVVTSLKAYMSQVLATDDYIMTNVPLDLTPFVFEKTAWSLLPQATAYTTTPTQLNTFWYEQGSSDGVYVGNVQKVVGATVYSYVQAIEAALSLFFGIGLSYPVTPSFSAFPNGGGKAWDMPLSLEFEAMGSGSVRVEGFADKGDGETAIAQAGQFPSLPRLGQSMLGTVSQKGEPTKGKLFPISSFAARPRRGSYYYDTDGSAWIVQATKCSALPGGWKCDVALVKNFNQLAGRVSVDRKATFSNISPSLSLQSEAVYQEYLYFCASAPTQFSTAPTLWTSAEGLVGACGYYLLTALTPAPSGVSYPYSAVACVRGLWSSRSGASQTSDYVALPLSVYGAGTAVCFEGFFPSSVSAGNLLTATSVSWFSDSLTSNAVRYCSPTGFADGFDLIIGSRSAASHLVFPSLPSLGSSYSAYIAAPLTAALSMDMPKRPNEIIGFNYEIAILPFPTDGAAQIMPYPALAEENFFSLGGKPKKIRLFALPVGGLPYEAFDTVARGKEISPASGFSALFGIVFGKPYAAATLKDGASTWFAPSSYSGWMLADAQGRPLIASNQSLTSGSSVSFWLLPSHGRL